MDCKDKFYHIPTMPGRYREPGLTAQLPAHLQINEPLQLELTINDDLPRWDATGRVHEVLLRFRIMNLTERDRLQFRINGKVLPDSALRRINEMYRMSAPRFRAGSGYWFIYRPERDNWPSQGKNTIEVTLLQRETDVLEEVILRDVELETKYLMGKQFHRGQDPDLGPSEGSGI